MDSYTLSYSFTVIGCDGHSGSFGNNNIMGIDGSTRMYTSSGLEEYTEFAIILTAVNGAGSASVSRAVRTMAGNYILGHDYVTGLGEINLNVEKYVCASTGKTL